jgi:hypothetical protein
MMKKKVMMIVSLFFGASVVGIGSHKAVEDLTFEDCVVAMEKMAVFLEELEDQALKGKIRDDLKKIKQNEIQLVRDYVRLYNERQALARAMAESWTAN